MSQVKPTQGLKIYIYVMYIQIISQGKISLN